MASNTTLPNARRPISGTGAPAVRCPPRAHSPRLGHPFWT
jgi:hypothetical protein